MTRSPSEPKGTTGTAFSSQSVITLAEATAVAQHTVTANAANRRICSIGPPLDGDAFFQAIARTGVPLGSEPIGYCRGKFTPGGVLMTTKSDGLPSTRERITDHFRRAGPMRDTHVATSWHAT